MHYRRILERGGQCYITVYLQFWVLRVIYCMQRMSNGFLLSSPQRDCNTMPWKYNITTRQHKLIAMLLQRRLYVRQQFHYQRDCMHLVPEQQILPDRYHISVSPRLGCAIRGNSIDPGILCVQSWLLHANAWLNVMHGMPPPRVLSPE